MNNWLSRNGWKVEEFDGGMDFVNEDLGVKVRCEGDELPWGDEDFEERIGQKDRLEIARYYFKEDMRNINVGVCLAELLSGFAQMFLYERFVEDSIALDWKIAIHENGKIVLTHEEEGITVDLVNNECYSAQTDMSRKKKIIEEDMNEITQLFCNYVRKG